MFVLTQRLNQIIILTFAAFFRRYFVSVSRNEVPNYDTRSKASVGSSTAERK